MTCPPANEKECGVPPSMRSPATALRLPLRAGFVRPALTFAGILGVAACSQLVDAEQARLCRTVIPALNPEGSEIAVQRTSPADDAHTLRIIYRVRPPGQPERTRFLACSFAAQTLSGARPALTGARTDQGPLSETALVFLRRYLDDPSAVLEDPGDPAAAGEVATAPRSVALAAQTVLNALPQIGVYGLVAAAYSLVYGLVGRIVFGFGEFAGIAGYAALLGLTIGLQLGIHATLPGLLLAAVVALFAALVHGVVSGRLVVSPLVRQASGENAGLPVLIATTGLMILLAEYQRLTQGSDLHWLPPVLNTPVSLLRGGDFVVTVTPVALLSAGVALAAALATLALMRFTGFGRQWRALADDALTASLFGVDRGKIFAITYALAAGLAGLAGFLVTTHYGVVGYSYGLTLGLKALVAAVVGGIGSVGGAFAGGVVIGVAEAVWSATMPIESRDVAIYALLSIMLALRPGGLFGYRDLLPRRV
jgi:branched-chain amino acid transport system permease protein